jgi:hypothetical protein
MNAVKKKLSFGEEVSKLLDSKLGLVLLGLSLGGSVGSGVIPATQEYFGIGPQPKIDSVWMAVKPLVSTVSQHDSTLGVIVPKVEKIEREWEEERFAAYSPPRRIRGSGRHRE